jgi:uncharacterized phiE125 gp8 family phage protein
MGCVLITPPAAEPVSTAEAKAHLRVDSDDENTLIDALVAAARQHIERETRRALITQTWELRLDKFPRDTIRTPVGPLQSVSSIKYDDINGVEQTLSTATYEIDTSVEPGWIVRVGDGAWPDTMVAINSVRVRFVAGYGAAAVVPQILKQAILLLVGHWYMNREVTIAGQFGASPMAVQSIIDSHHVPLLA